MNLAFFRRAPTSRAVFPEVLDLAGRRVALVVATSPAARRLTLRADPAKACVKLTMPRGVAAAKAAAFIADQHVWLAARVARWPSPRPILPGAELPFEDGALVVEWFASGRRAPVLDDRRLVVGGPLDALAGRVERWLKAEALRALAADSAAIAATIDRSPPPVRIGDPKGRWGSCNAKGELAYSWRLIMAPVGVRRAVAAHEVAHLVHHDHSAAFHDLADRLSGGTAKSSSRWLAAHGAALHWVGRS